jgi:hypothetical protein
LMDDMSRLQLYRDNARKVAVDRCSRERGLNNFRKVFSETGWAR